MPAIDFIWNYIQDTSGIFSKSSLWRYRWCHSFVFRFFNFWNTHIYVIKRKLHVGLNIWSSSSCGKKFLFFPLEDKFHMFTPPCNIPYILRFSTFLYPTVCLVKTLRLYKWLLLWVEDILLNKACDWLMLSWG